MPTWLSVLLLITGGLFFGWLTVLLLTFIGIWAMHPKDAHDDILNNDPRGKK